MQEAQPKNANKGLLIAIICGAVATLAIVAVIIVLVLTGGKADLVGTWKLQSMKEGDKEFNVEQLEKFGMSGSMTFNADGTGVYKQTGLSDSKFAYDKDKMTASIEGDEAKLSVSGKTLTVESGDMTMKLEKE